MCKSYSGCMCFRPQGPQGQFNVTQVVTVTPPSQGTWASDVREAEGFEHEKSTQPEVSAQNTLGLCPSPAPSISLCTAAARTWSPLCDLCSL